MFLAGANQVVGPEAVAQYVNVGDYFKRRATALGIETEGLIKSDEQLQQEAQAAQMQQMTEKLGGPAINAMNQQALAQQQQAEPQQ